MKPVLMPLVGAVLLASTSAQVPQVPTLPVLHQFSVWSGGVQPRFGHSVTILDDIDGDGCADIVVSMISPNDAFVYSGCSGNLIRSHLDSGGFLTKALHDFDLDGIGDYAVAGGTAGGPLGNAVVYSAWTGAPLLAVTDLLPYADFDSIDDVDGDGIPELVVSSRDYGTSLLGLGAGFVDVYSGGSGTLLHRTTGTIGNEHFGLFIESLDDLDGNGSPELMVVSWGGFAGPGVLPPLASEQIFTVTATGLQLYSFNVNSRMPVRVGDVDGDGVQDYVMSRRANPNNAPVTTPEVTLYSGQTGQSVVTYQNPTGVFDDFGSWVGPAGDIDGDGLLDVAVSARFSPMGTGPTPSYATSLIHVFSGPTGQLLHTLSSGVNVAGLSGTALHAYLGVIGEHIAGGGDCDGDGIDDLIVGFPELNGNAGLARVYRGVGPFAPATAAGTVNAQAAGGVLDVLGISQPGAAAPLASGPTRTVVLPVGSPIALWMTRPPLNALGLTPYVVYGRVWPAPNFATHLLPYGIGAMTFLPPPLAPADPLAFTFADTWGGGSALVPAWPALFPAPGAVSAVTAGIPFPVSFALQGIILDASAPWPGVAVTNALRVIVR